MVKNVLSEALCLGTEWCVGCGGTVGDSGDTTKDGRAVRTSWVPSEGTSQGTVGLWGFHRGREGHWDTIEDMEGP